MREPRVKIALVGLGRWGTNVARELAAEGSLGAVVSRTPNEPAVQEASKKFGVPAISLSDMCMRTEISAAWVTTPIATHGATAEKILAAGKHLMLEKPATGNAKEAESLAKKATERGLIFATGYIFLYHPVFAELARRIHTTSLREVNCVWEKYGTFEEPITINLFTHHVSLALALLGTPRHGTVRTASNGNVLDAELVYPQLTFHSHINRESKEKAHTIDFTLADGTVYRWDNQKLFLQNPGTSELKTVFESQESALANERAAFTNAVAADNASFLPSSGDFGSRVLKILDEIR